MITIVDPSSCSGCFACGNACPIGCISMAGDREGFDYPHVDAGRCVECGRCEGLCEPPAPAADPPEPSAYAARARSPELVRESTSGGVFSLLAQWILSQGGAVYGAAVCGGAAVRHIRVTDATGLARLRGSKYVQSAVGTAYRRVREDLAAGTWVLFTGTPCQVGGLLGTLDGAPRKTLVCQDLFCHGVPSPKALRRFLQGKGFDPDRDLELRFRDKRTGWSNSSMVARQQSRTYARPFRKNPYQRAFVADIMLRPSCHRCRYRDMNFKGDLTLGDFWGVAQVLPDFADPAGTSAVLVNTETGRELFEQILPQMDVRPVTAEEAFCGNGIALRGVLPHPNREAFVRELDAKPFDRLVGEYVTGPFFARVRRVLRRRLRC